MKKKTRPKTKRKSTKTRSKISTKRISKRISTKPHSKRIPKRKNPILISDDQKVVTFEELLAFSDSETKEIINYLLDRIEFGNLDSVSPEILFNMIDWSMDHYNTDDITRSEYDKIAQFERDLLKLPKHLIIELPDYERSEKIYSKTLDKFGNRKPVGTLPLHWKRLKHN